ncbi:MAG TPA: hypothetical protein VNC59_04440 [Thermoanaerobaculia bacterium]|nr:hypothetical protein [Thermoanaerobaculia bacterium]
MTYPLDWKVIEAPAARMQGSVPPAEHNTAPLVATIGRLPEAGMRVWSAL